MRELQSGFKFFECYGLKECLGTGAGGVTGVDLQGYETCTFAVHFYSVSGTAAGISLVSRIYCKIQHAHGSVSTGICSGPDSTWSNCSDTDVLMGTTSVASASAWPFISKSMSADDGIWLSIYISGTSLASAWSRIYTVAYIGNRRFVRILVSASAAADCSAVICGGMAILGYPANWPVNAISANV
jgi:hypothetical protein